jgi:hydrogenase maturation protein HypF
MDELQASALRGMLRGGVGTVATSSCGRLFDAVAALCGRGLEPSYEGQPAMELEFLAAERREEPYPLEVIAAEPLRINPAPALAQILDDLEAGAERGAVAARFQTGLVRALARACVGASQATGIKTVALGGGCFQNRFLARELRARLEARGLRGVLPRRIPANDGGLALGQVVVHAARSK